MVPDYQMRPGGLIFLEYNQDMQKSKESKSFEILRWLTIGFAIASIGVALAVVLYIFSTLR